MAANRGKLLVTTRTNAAGRKTVIVVYSVIMYAFALFSLLNQDTFAKMGRDVFYSVAMGRMVGWVIIAFLIAFPSFLLIMSVKGSKSYCDVYEYAVAGMTCLSASNPNAVMQNFELPYQQIVNLTSSSKTITIQTNHGSYEVLALKNRDEAMQEIRSRMSEKR